MRLEEAQRIINESAYVRRLVAKMIETMQMVPVTFPAEKLAERRGIVTGLRIVDMWYKMADKALTDALREEVPSEPDAMPFPFPAEVIDLVLEPGQLAEKETERAEREQPKTEGSVP